MSALILFVFLGAAVLAMPIAHALLVAAMAAAATSDRVPLDLLVQQMVAQVQSFPLIAIPFFMLTGSLMMGGRLGAALVGVLSTLIGRFHGGPAQVGVLSSTLFGGVSGSAVADASAIGSLLIPWHKRLGYPPAFSAATLAAAATIDILIPPSIPIILYSLVSGVSVGALFLAGILPGVMLAILMMLTVAYFAHKNNWGGDTKFSSTRLFKALAELAVVVGWPMLLWLLVAKLGTPPQLTVFAGLASLFVLDKIFKFEALLPIMTPVLLIGGMTTGLFTPTEGAIAACVWALILGFAWYRTLKWKMFVKVCLDTIETTSTVLFIVAAASIFGWMLTATGVTTDIASWVLGFTNEAWVFLLLANLLMLFVGCFLEPTAAITILVPILLPIATQLGIDPVHFGLVMVLNLMIGLLHPPMGMVLFVLARVAGLSFERTTMAILPWLIPLLAALVIITYVPSLVLWLPKMFY